MTELVYNTQALINKMYCDAPMDKVLLIKN